MDTKTYTKAIQYLHELASSNQFVFYLNAVNYLIDTFNINEKEAREIIKDYKEKYGE